MEMPDVIYAGSYFEDTVWNNEWRVTKMTGSERYTHSRIVEALKAENHELENNIYALEQKLKCETICGCSYDRPEDICMAHLPIVEALRKENEELKAKLDKANGATNELAESLRFCIKKIEKLNGECNATYISKEKLKKYAPEQP